ncbi:MAG: pyrroline-5-carboxylate reductase [Rhodospirillales bacterium RIFCSPLOWO2_12_FULL_58_28]|nr:MAG: pyrroline-5-carboxylate reductase [Rhodospirillales bacterium RIFCSPLOWO2_02_FULL_58_16]OHC78289.1 MAG: pyrroline-5-carboxylate reductase [Rhodospirillales bacterium RIFCSPLOWO2_12_FULL_58_28]
MTVRLVLAGCGKMGGALLGGWLERGIKNSDIIVIDPNAEVAAGLGKRFGVKVGAAADAINDGVRPGVVVFAVKPQAMDGVVPAYARFAGHGCVFLSIAAGKTIAYFEEKLGKGAAVVRCMPNTPAAVRRGITVACSNQRVTADQRLQCSELLEAVGDVAWIDDEGLLDAVTAVSGSGPAYVFLLTECLARAGVEAGLPEGLAERLAKATVSGAGELMRLASDKPEILRSNVTSPGGTTAEALAVLMADNGLQRLMTDAVGAATGRSRELAG